MDLYSASSQKSLFGEMSKTYGLVNLVASFGFTTFWRHACVRQIKPSPDAVIVDLMTGMGELFHGLDRAFAAKPIRTIAIDFSPEMCAQARQNAARYSQIKAEILEVDALDSSLESSSVDHIFCSFGLKTLSRDQQSRLASEVARLLKPGGQFSFIEISVPPNVWFRALFLFYLRQLIPFIGKLFLGSPANYRMLARYTEAFENSRFFAGCLRAQRLETRDISHIFGAATGVAGSKPH